MQKNLHTKEAGMRGIVDVFKICKGGALAISNMVEGQKEDTRPREAFQGARSGRASANSYLEVCLLLPRHSLSPHSYWRANLDPYQIGEAGQKNTRSPGGRKKKDRSQLS